MSDLSDLRRKAAQQASTGNYWAAKFVALADAYAQLQAVIEGAVAGGQKRDAELQARIDDLNMKLGAAEGELHLAAQSIGAPDWAAVRQLMARHIKVTNPEETP